MEEKAVCRGMSVMLPHYLSPPNATTGRLRSPITVQTSWWGSLCPLFPERFEMGLEFRHLIF